MPLTENQKQSRYKYAKENLKRIPLDVQKEKYEEIKTHAITQKETVNGFIKRAIDETIGRDNSTLSNNIDKQKESGSTNTPDFK